jgi:hypothetical protein
MIPYVIKVSRKIRPVLIGLLDDNCNELTAPDYSRVPAEMKWDDGVYKTTTDVDFPKPLSDWGLVFGLVVFDPSGGVELARGKLSMPHHVLKEDRRVCFEKGNIWFEDVW